jgi:F0F1-type ATP synthase alpha subunit
MLPYMEKEHPDILAAVRDKKEIDTAIEANLNKALAAFKEKFSY